MALKCPLKRHPDSGKQDVFGFCEEEKCAWYDKAEKRCSIAQISRGIERLADRVQDLSADFLEQILNLQAIINHK